MLPKGPDQNRVSSHTFKICWNEKASVCSFDGGESISPISRSGTCAIVIIYTCSVTFLDSQQHDYQEGRFTNHTYLPSVWGIAQWPWLFITQTSLDRKALGQDWCLDREESVGKSPSLSRKISMSGEVNIERKVKVVRDRIWKVKTGS